MPLHTADALVLRTYKLGEANRIVVFLTADRGKKRGVAERARRPRSPFRGALEPLTHVRVAYYENERRELVGVNYAEPVTSPLVAASPEALGYSHYFAELIDEWAAEADPDERLFRLGIATLEAMVEGVAVEPLARYFECWLLKLQGVYPGRPVNLAGGGGVRRRGSAGRAARGRGPGGDDRDPAGTGTRAPHAHTLAARPRAPIDSSDSRVAPRAGALKWALPSDLSRSDPETLRVLGLQGLSHSAGPRPRGGGRHFASRNAAARTRHDAVERGLCAAVPPSRRRPLRPESEPPLQTSPDAGDPQAVARRRAADVSREPRGLRHQPAAARHPLRGGQLGIADAGRLGHRLAGAARRAGDQPVHLLPAGRRRGPVAGVLRNHLRARTHRHVPAAG